MYLLDTNICIYALKGMFPALKRRLMAHPPSEFGIPSIVKAELLFGANKSQSRDRTLRMLKGFLAPFCVVPFGDDEAKHYAEIRAGLEKTGKPIGPNDLIIAATALSQGASLITRNGKEFSRVKGLIWEDWTV